MINKLSFNIFIDSVLRILSIDLKTSLNFLVIPDILDDSLAKAILTEVGKSEHESSQLIKELKCYPIWHERTNNTWTFNEDVRQYIIEKIDNIAVSRKIVLSEMKKYLGKINDPYLYIDYYIQIARLSLIIGENKKEVIYALRKIFDTCGSFGQFSLEFISEAERVVDLCLSENFSENSDYGMNIPEEILSVYYMRGLYAYKTKRYREAMYFLSPVWKQGSKNSKVIVDASISAYLIGLMLSKSELQLKDSKIAFCESIQLSTIANVNKCKAQALLVINNLIGADLSESDLRDAFLHEAHLNEADLSKANLSKANLSEADLKGAYMRRANLSEANLSKAKLSGVDLSGANLSGADLNEFYLNKATYTRGANLSEADLSEADLSEANLKGANLSGANLRGTNLSKANLREVDLSGADLREADLSGVDLSGANLSGADLSGVDLSRANLNGADLNGIDLRRANLNEANLSKTNLNEADLSKAKLSGAYLSEAKLKGAKLKGAYMRKANLSEADLNGADLREANLSEANLNGVDLSVIDLRGANLNGVNILMAKYDANTLFNPN